MLHGEGKVNPIHNSYRVNWIALGSLAVTILVIVFTAGNFVGNSRTVPGDLKSVREDVIEINKELNNEINRSKNQDQQIILQLTLNLRSIEKRISNLEATTDNIYKILLAQQKEKR